MAEIGEWLVREGLLSSAQWQEAVQIQKAKPGHRLEEILVLRGMVEERKLMEVISRNTGARTVDLEKTRLDLALRDLIPHDLAKRLWCVPLQRREGVLFVAMLNPSDAQAVQTLAARSGCTVKALVTGPVALKKAWEKLYGDGGVRPEASGSEAVSHPSDERKGMDQDTVGALMRTSVDVVRELSAGEGMEAEEEQKGVYAIDKAEKSPVVRLVNSLLSKAVGMNASDIHIEPFADEVRVRFRIDGALLKVLSIPSSAKNEVVSRVKIMSMMDIAERRVPQDGRLQLQMGGEIVDFRVNTLPGVYGEKVVLRILGQGEIREDISQLGFRKEAYQLIQEAILNPYGMILVTGPTGSGKTTTLYTILQELNREHVNIVTAEDPVEYHLKGITQVTIRSSIGFTFDVALRAFLRQDPDIILVGEMRDYETATIAVRAALTGHLVLSTLHTNDCPSTVVRLVDMGIEPYMVASSVKLVLAQRLVRRICTHCKEEVPLSEVERMDVDETVVAALERLYRGKGCVQCHNIGYKGRAPVFEALPVRSIELKRIITEGGTEVQVGQVARREGFRTLRDEALQMVNEGVTTLEETIGIIMAS